MKEPKETIKVDDMYTNKSTADSIEFDVSPPVWDMYKIVYEHGISKYFDLNNPIEKNGRKIAQIKKEKKHELKLNKYNDFSVSGDVVFNFSKKGKPGESRYDIYRKHIESLENEELKKVYLKKLEVCDLMNYSFENCALLFRKGCLQIAKQGIGNDRGDTFIWALDMYYEEGCGIILNHSSQENVEALKDFLELFRVSDKHKSVYKYCELFYNIYDTELIDKLINSGLKPLDSAERVISYIELALAFWGNRSKYYHMKKQEKLQNGTKINSK